MKKNLTILFLAVTTLLTFSVENLNAQKKVYYGLNASGKVKSITSLPETLHSRDLVWNHHIDDKLVTEYDKIGNLISKSIYNPRIDSDGNKWKLANHVTYKYDYLGNIIEENSATDSSSRLQIISKYYKKFPSPISEIYIDYNANNEILKIDTIIKSRIDTLRNTINQYYTSREGTNSTFLILDAKQNVIRFKQKDYSGNTVSCIKTYNENNQLLTAKCKNIYNKDTTENFRFNHYDNNGRLIGEFQYSKGKYPNRTKDSTAYFLSGGKEVYHYWYSFERNKYYLSSTFLYDQFGNTLRCIEFKEFETKRIERLYSYKFDNHNNWIEKTIEVNGIPKKNYKRILKYYE